MKKPDNTPMTVICYIPMLEGQEAEVRQWTESVRGWQGVTPVILPLSNWNDDLTPWPSGAIFKKGKSFGGKAEAYLHNLETDIIPSVEKEMGITPDERWLLGVSLSGLFAVWAAFRTGLFSRVATVSGSFWYPGFVSWLEGQTAAGGLKSISISLGDKESQTKNLYLKSIASDTLKVKGILERKGVQVSFGWTAGTHFAPVAPRLDEALWAMMSLAGILPRCPGVLRAGEPLLSYHDKEWGRPEHDEHKLLEMFFLELFQAGLSWTLLLRKREGFRRAFDGFDVNAIAAYGEAKVDELMQDVGIVRNRAKIEAAVSNARIVLDIQKEWRSFSKYLWHFTGGKTILEDVSVTRDALSDDVSKDMRRRGLRFAGSVTIFSFLQAVGIIYSHSPGCFCSRRDKAASFAGNTCLAQNG